MHFVFNSNLKRVGPIKNNMIQRNFTPSQLILRDFLALDRTHLANERTLLSYFRSGLTMVIAGVSGYNIFQNIYMKLSGVGFAVGGLSLAAYGIFRYTQMDKRLKKVASPEQIKAVSYVNHTNDELV